MPKKSIGCPTRLQPASRRAAADLINEAFKKSDVPEICQAIGAATHLYNISHLAEKSGIARTSIHRTFARDPQKPIFTTILRVLDAMGFQLQVKMRRNASRALEIG